MEGASIQARPLIFQSLLPDLAPSSWLPRLRRAGPSTSLD